MLTEECRLLCVVQTEKEPFQLLNGECPNIFGVFGVKKVQKFANFRADLVKFQVEKVPFLFVPHTTIGTLQLTWSIKQTTVI